MFQLRGVHPQEALKKLNAHMLVIRFNTVGRKNHKQYRIAVQEKSQAPGGRHVALVGSYNPHSKETILKTDEIKDWIAKGAQPSDSVYNLLIRNGVIEGEKRKVKVPKKKIEETDQKEAVKEEKVDEENKSEEKSDEKTADNTKTEEVKDAEDK